MSFCCWDFDWYPRSPLPRPVGMEADTPRARARARRKRQILDELLATVRRFNPTLPDDQLLEMAERMAELRLLDEDIG